MLQCAINFWVNGGRQLVAIKLVVVVGWALKTASRVYTIAEATDESGLATAAMLR
jgi:hypothetical protein